MSYIEVQAKWVGYVYNSKYNSNTPEEDVTMKVCELIKL